MEAAQIVALLNSTHSSLLPGSYIKEHVLQAIWLVAWSGRKVQSEILAEPEDQALRPCRQLQSIRPVDVDISTLPEEE